MINEPRSFAAGKFSFTEDFTGMPFLNDPVLRDDGSSIRIEVERHNVRAIAAFMLFIVVVSASVTFFADGFRSSAVVLLGGLMAGSMFVGVFAFSNMESDAAKLPFIDRETESMVLATGTRIPKSEVAYFRVNSCRTKLSNFRVVLISLARQNESGESQLAVIPVTGKIEDAGIVHEFADYFGVEVKVDDQCISDVEGLRSIGIV